MVLRNGTKIERQAIIGLQIDVEQRYVRIAKIAPLFAVDLALGGGEWKFHLVAGDDSIEMASQPSLL